MSVLNNRFVVDLATPGLKADVLHEGFNRDLELVTVVVGKEEENQRHWQLPIKHLTTIKYFSGAFNSGFRESVEKKITLGDEDPEAFAILVTWLYQGIQTLSNLPQSILLWTRVFLMVDMWNLEHFAKNALLHISNLILEQTAWNAENGSIRYLEALECYRLMGDHAARYLPLHNLSLIMRFIIPSRICDGLSDTSFGMDYVRWHRIVDDYMLTRPQRPTPMIHYHEAHEGSCAVLDVMLMPILFADWKWPEDLDHSFEFWSKENRTPRAIVREILDI